MYNSLFILPIFFMTSLQKEILKKEDWKPTPHHQKPQQTHIFSLHLQKEILKKEDWKNKWHEVGTIRGSW